MLACTAMLVGCNNDDVVNNDLPLNEKGEAYLAVNIITNGSGSRTTTDDFEDGKGNENKADKVRFYFFTEDGSPFTTTGKSVNYYDVTLTLTEHTVADPDAVDGSIESHSEAIVVINGEENNGAPKSIVAVLNPETAGFAYNAMTDQALTLDQFKVKYGEYGKFGENPFVMTNSVYAEGGVVKMEAAVKPENLSISEEGAKTNPINIHVERVAAKISVAAGGQTAEGTPAGAYDTGVTVGSEKVYAKIVGVSTAHENKTSYLVKQIEAGWTDEITGITGWNEPLNHRSYWAKSYVPETYTSENSWTETAKNTTFIDYCLENTSKDPETEVLFAAKLLKANGADFEIAEWMGKKYVGGETALKTDMANYLKDYWYIKTPASGGTPATYEQFNLNDIVFTVSTDADESYEVIAGLSPSTNQYYTKDVNGDYVEDTNNTQIKAEIAKFAHAKIWKSGMTYYYTPIKHLDQSGNAVVRNHVYKITVNSITGLGTPVYDPEKDIPTITPTDDKTYVAAQIYVKAWRIVNQDVDLNSSGANQ